MKKILIASSNPSKKRLYAESLGNIFDLVFLNELERVVIFPPENEPTVEGNAILKAKTAYEATGIPALGDDAGVEIDALGGEPGVMARRWGGILPDDVSDEDWIDFFMKKTAHVPEAERTGKFTVARAYFDGGEPLVQRFEIPFTYDREVRRPYHDRWPLSGIVRQNGMHRMDMLSDPNLQNESLQMMNLIEMLKRK